MREAKLCLLVVDLAGYTRAVASLEALQVAEFLDAWYRECARAIRARGGRVVKYMGDACLAVFPEEKTVDAVDAAMALRAPAKGLDLKVGANVHLAVVAEGDLGPDDDKRYDVLGSGVNHLFLMGGAAGVRISEPVYRQLPNDRRGPWKKHKPPATYSL